MLTSLVGCVTSSRPRHELAEDLFAEHSASGMGALSFMSADLFAYLLNFLEMEDACRLGSLNRFFQVRRAPSPHLAAATWWPHRFASQALLSPRGYAWRQFYIRSAYYDHEKFLEMDKSNDSNWKSLCASNHRVRPQPQRLDNAPLLCYGDTLNLYYFVLQMGWQLDTSPLRCGEAFMLQKDLLGCVVDKTYKGPVLVQRVVTKRGVWRGRHLFSVKVEGYSPGAPSLSLSS